MENENFNKEEHEGTSKLDKLAGFFDTGKFQTLNQEMTFSEYIDSCYKSPGLVRSAYQRVYDMIMNAGTSEFKKYRKTYIHYNFFDNDEIPIYGLDNTLHELVKFIRGAAGWYGTEKKNSSSPRASRFV